MSIEYGQLCRATGEQGGGDGDLDGESVAGESYFVVVERCESGIVAWCGVAECNGEDGEGEPFGYGGGVLAAVVDTVGGENHGTDIASLVA